MLLKLCNISSWRNCSVAPYSSAASVIILHWIFLFNLYWVLCSVENQLVATVYEVYWLNMLRATACPSSGVQVVTTAFGGQPWKDIRSSEFWCYGAVCCSIVVWRAENQELLVSVMAHRRGSLIVHVYSCFMYRIDSSNPTCAMQYTHMHNSSPHPIKPHPPRIYLILETTPTHTKLMNHVHVPSHWLITLNSLLTKPQ
jgi:hypothetical protein